MDYSLSRSNYLKIMLDGLNKEIDSLKLNSIDSVGDTSYDDAELNRIQNQNINAIKNSKEIVKIDRNGWQRFWDTIGEISDDITEGLLNFADDVVDFLVFDTIDAISGGKAEWAQKARDYDWQSQAMKFSKFLTPVDILTGDVFSADYYGGWDSKSARDTINKRAESSLYNELGNDAHQFLKGLNQNIGYMIPSIAVGVATGGGSTAAQGATAASKAAKIASLSTMAVGAFTGKADEAYKESGNYGKAVLAGALNAGIEVGTELIFPEGKVAGVVGNQTAHATFKEFAKELGHTMLEEGVEEVIAGVLEPNVNAIYKGKDAYYDEKGRNVYTTTDFWFGTNGHFNESVLGQGISGAVMGGLMGGPQMFSNDSQMKRMIGKEGIETINAHENLSQEYEKLSKLEKGTEKYNQQVEKVAIAVAEYDRALYKLPQSLNSEQMKNFTTLLGDPTKFFNKMNDNEISKEFSKQIKSLSKEANDVERFGTRNLFNSLQEKFGTDYKLEFKALKGNNNAKVNSKTRTIVIDTKIADKYASSLAHEYLGHVIGENMNSTTRQSIYDKVVNSNWFKENEAKLRKAYTTSSGYKSLKESARTKYYQTEVINKYIESILNQTSNSSTTRVVGDVFLRNSLLNRLSANFNKKHGLNIAKNNAILSEFSKTIDNLFKVTDKRVSSALRSFLDGKELSKKEKKIYEQYKDIFDTIKESSSEEKLVELNSKKIRKYTVKISKETRSEIEKQLKRYYNETKQNIVNDFVAISGNDLYIVDSSIEDGEISFGVYRKFEFNNNELVKKFREEIKDGIIKNGGYSDRKIRSNGNVGSNFSRSGEKGEFRKVIQTSNGESKNDTGRVRRANGDSGGVKYSKNLDIFDVSKVKIGENGKIIEDENTKILFDKARDSQEIAKLKFESVKKEIFEDIATKYNISLNIGFSNPSMKSVSSFADRLYRNIIEGKSSETAIVKDWIRGSYIFDADNISSVANIISELKENIVKIDVKDHPSYKGIHLNLIVDGVPVEIQLHTKESWELKLESDTFYEKYRSIDKKSLSQEELDKANKLEDSFKIKWSQILDNRDFQALRASVSEVKNSTSSSLGSTSNPNTDLEGLTHSPSTYSNNSPKNLPLNNRLDADKTYSSIDSSSPSNNNIAQNDDNLNPYETNKAKEIKEGAKEKEGKYITLKSVNDIYNEIEKSISNYLGEDFKIDSKNLKARRLFEEFNIAKNDSKKSNCKKFVKDILNQDIIAHKYIGDGSITYGEYLESRGVNIDKIINEGTELFYELLNSKAIESDTTKKLAKLEQWIKKYDDAKQDFKSVMQFTKHLNSIKKVLSKYVSKYGTGQLDMDGGARGLFSSYFNKFRYTKGQYLSLTNMTNLQTMVEDGSFNHLIDSILNPNNEVNNLPSLINLSETIKDMAVELSSSVTTKQTHLNYEQVTMFDNLNRAMYKLYKDYTSGVLEATREQSIDLIEQAKKVAGRTKASDLKNKLNTALFDAASPKEIIAYMCGGTHTKAFNLIYNDLYKKPYENQVGKYVDFLMERDGKNQSNIKHISKNQNKTIKIDGVKMNRYVLYQFYLNTLSPENNVRMKNSNLAYTRGTTSKISYDSLNSALELLTPEEISELDKLFALYNGSVKEYVEKMSEKIFGFSVSRENYYPIVGSDAFKMKDFSNPNQMRYNINALNNGRLKKLSNNRTVIEINVNPITLFNDYIESMTITGEIGLESQKLNRLFQLKNNGESFASIISSYLPNTQTYISSIFNKLIGNTQTIERTALLDKLIGRFSTATLGLNVRSMMKQLGSYFTAWEKVGLSSALKTSLNPASISKIMKNSRWLKEHNNIFKLRIYDNGYVKSATLSSGSSQFASSAIRKINEFSMKGMEALDRFTCYATFTLCEDYIRRTNPAIADNNKILELASEMWNDVILDTQSNSDRIAMSRIRSGEKGWIAKNMFGLFQSDAQNKASQILESHIDRTNIDAELKEIDAKIKSTTDEEIKESLIKEKESIKKMRSDVSSRMKTIASGLLLSSITAVLADLIADWIYDKNEPEDTELPDVLLNILFNATIDNIPYLNSIVSWWNYGGVQMPAFETVNDLMDTVKGFLDGDISREDYIKAIMSFMTILGLPVNNLNKLIQGTIGNFNPSLAIKYKSIFYGMSQSYLGKQANEQIEKNHMDKAKAIILLNYQTYKFSMDDSVVNEIVSLKKEGVHVSIKNRPSAIEGSVLSDEKLYLFDREYSKANDAIKKVIRDSNYKKLSLEEKAKVINKIANTYFDIAKSKVGGIELSSKLQILAKKNIDITKFVPVMYELENSIVESKDKKQVILKNLNDHKEFTRAEKLLISILMGYSISESGKGLLNNYLRNLGFTKSEIEKIL